MLTGRKLALTLAFMVLIALAAGVSCSGFFQPSSLTAIAIQPPSPQIEIGSTTTQTLQAWGTYSDNSRSQITSGVSWTSSPSTIVEITGACANAQSCGSATAEGVGSGTSTITASAQGLSANATATAYLGNVSGFEVCFSDLSTCSSGSNPLVWDATNAGTTSPSATFIAQGTSGGTTYDLTTESTWTPVGSPAGISCTNTGISPETCTVTEKTANNTYPVTVTYGTSSTATLNIVVTQ